MILEKYIDNIFEALYGSKYDEDKKAYKDVYKYEVLDILYDFEGYICCIQAVNLPLDIYGVCTLIIYLEDKNITNEELVSKNFSYEKLKNTVIKIIQELNEELD